jgi:hypothetical protein
VAKNAHRLRERDEPNNRIVYRDRQEILYARTANDQRNWHGADKEVVISALDRTEMQVARLVSFSRKAVADDLAELVRKAEAANDNADDEQADEA